MTVITLVVATLIALPLVGLIAARLTSNQFVRETEGSLLSQAAIMAEVYAREYRKQSSGPPHGQPLTSEQTAFYAAEFHHTPVSLTTRAETIFPERPDPAPTGIEVSPVYKKIGAVFSELASKAQKASLAGYQAVDVHGNIIGGIGALEGGFADLPEIQSALHGETVTLLRYRADKNRRHPLASISRDTGFRVFVAMPVIVENHVVGAVYLTRTPSNLGSFLYRERQTILLVSGSVLLAATVVGLLLWRLLAGPIRALQQQSEHVATGQITMPKPIEHYGTKETAKLGQSILSMSTKLKQRSDSLQSYTAHVTHELKSPLTSIVGAIELLEQSGGRMDAADQRKFYKNIQEDGARMTRLLDDLRSLAASDMAAAVGSTDLASAVARCQSEFPDLHIDYIGPDGTILPIAEQDLNVVLVHLAQNAQQHGATKLTVSASQETVSIADDGSGISPANLDMIFQPFFTTKRDTGGTGMGLAIVQSTLKSYGGNIRVDTSAGGARFALSFDI
ncbi:MAG: HAMP domain-containing sensor histidine kinase [Albidovulum sp.]